jgi:CheY-like chemotaxis protein
VGNLSLVLIADDDAAIRSQLKPVLEKAGHKIVEAGSARADHDDG